MHLIVAVIRPSRLEAVRDALAAIGVQGMTASEVKGHGRQKGQPEIYRGAEYQVSFVPKIRLEIAVPASLTSKVIDTIKAEAKSGKIGDGKIFVLELKEAVRIRTDESGAEAL